MNHDKRLSTMSETRLKILTFIGKKMSAIRIANEMNVNVSGVSRHLRICKEMGLVNGPYMTPGSRSGWIITARGVALIEVIHRLKHTPGVVIVSGHEVTALLTLISEA